MLRFSPAHQTVCILSLDGDLVSVDTYRSGELARTEQAPAYKLRQALTDPKGRYRLTQAYLATQALTPAQTTLVARLNALLWPAEAHYAKVLSNALENLQSRLNRGQDLEKAASDVSDLYGVSLPTLYEAYDEMYA